MMSMICHCDIRTNQDDEYEKMNSKDLFLLDLCFLQFCELLELLHKFSLSQCKS